MRLSRRKLFVGTIVAALVPGTALAERNHTNDPMPAPSAPVQVPHFHEVSGAPTPAFGVRAWGRVDISGKLLAGGNIERIQRSTSGSFRITMDQAMQRDQYAVIATARVLGFTCSSDILNAKVFDVYVDSYEGGQNNVDDFFEFVVVGD